MKLSDLVFYLNEMELTDVSAIRAATEHDFAGVIHAIDSKTIDPGGYKIRMNRRFIDVCQSLEQFDKVFTNLKADLESGIARLEPAVYSQFERVYNDVVKWESNQTVFERRLGIDDDSNLLLRSRLKNYTDWRHPGLIIRPGTETFIEEMVPLDPLYVVDHNKELIEPALNSFNEVYRNRLRDYVITENNNELMGNLPNDQFGTVFAYNFFNYKPMSLIERYLREIYRKLKPGGTLIMTFNDCDRAHGVRLAENNYMSYTPAKTLKATVESIGYEVLYQHNGQGDLAWLELGKPGALTSLRGGQTLAKIMPK